MSQAIETIIRETTANVAAPKGDPGGSMRGAIRLFLHTYAGGACVTCGHVTLLDAPSSDPRQATIGHLASVGNSKRGMRPGAVAVQCRECQDRQGNASLLPYLTSERAARVPLTWPTPKALMATYMATRASDSTDTYRQAVTDATRDLPW